MQSIQILKQIRTALTYQQLNNLIFNYIEELQMAFKKGRISVTTYIALGRFFVSILEAV